MHYSIYPAKAEYTLTISVCVQTQNTTETEFFLPTWRPGKYMQQAYASRITIVQASGKNNKTLHIQKNGVSSWSVKHDVNEKVTIKYEYSDNTFDAGNHAYVSEKMINITPAVCCLYTLEHRKEKVTLNIKIPRNWQYACALTSNNQGYLVANNYDELADSPFFAAPCIQTTTHFFEGLTVHTHFLGKLEDGLWNTITSGIETLVQHQLTLFGSCPVSNYHFLLFSTPSVIDLHAVEHQASTLVYVNENSPRYKSKQEWLFQLLSTCTHEFFHTWNITAIRPVELKEYNYQQPQPFPTCYVAEGLTTYLTQLFVWQTNMAPWNKGFKENDIHEMATLFWHSSKPTYSLREGSFNLWLDSFNPALGYAGDPYLRGCLAWWMMDLEMMKITNNQYRVAHILPYFYKQHGYKPCYYTEDDLINIVSYLCGKNMKPTWKKLFWEYKNFNQYLKQAPHTLGFVWKKHHIYSNFMKKIIPVYGILPQYNITDNQKKLFTSWSSLEYDNCDIS